MWVLLCISYIPVKKLPVKITIIFLLVLNILQILMRSPSVVETELDSTKRGWLTVFSGKSRNSLASGTAGFRSYVFFSQPASYHTNFVLGEPVPTCWTEGHNSSRLTSYQFGRPWAGGAGLLANYSCESPGVDSGDSLGWRARKGAPEISVKIVSILGHVLLSLLLILLLNPLMRKLNKLI